jgi:hypothetical protein
MKLKSFFAANVSPEVCMDMERVAFWHEDCLMVLVFHVSRDGRKRWSGRTTHVTEKGGARTYFHDCIQLHSS